MFNCPFLCSQALQPAYLKELNPVETRIRPQYHSVVFMFVVALYCLFLEALALVIELLALSEPYLQLDLSVLEIDGKGDKGESLLCCLSEQPVDLPFMHQELSYPKRILVEDIAFLIRGYVHLMYEHLSIRDLGIGIPQIYFSLPYGFDFGTGKSYPGFISVQDEVIMSCLSVVCDQFDPFAHFFNVLQDIDSIP